MKPTYHRLEWKSTAWSGAAQQDNTDLAKSCLLAISAVNLDIVTARQRSFGMVLFLLACVCSQGRVGMPCTRSLMGYTREYTKVMGLPGRTPSTVSDIW